MWSLIIEQFHSNDEPVKSFDDRNKFTQTTINHDSSDTFKNITVNLRNLFKVYFTVTWVTWNNKKKGYKYLHRIKYVIGRREKGWEFFLKKNKTTKKNSRFHRVNSLFSRANRVAGLCK